MTRYAYLAEDMKGQLVRGEIEATDSAGAQDRLGLQRLRIITLEPMASQTRLFSRRRRSSKDLTRLLSDLDRLLRARMPLADTLGMLGEKDDRVGAIAKDVLDEIRAGKSLSSALGSLDLKPAPHVTALIAAGEATGQLSKQIGVIVTAAERQTNLRKELVGQLLYPAALLVLTVATLYFLAFFVLPQFEDLFSDPGLEPPAITLAVIGAGRWIRNWAWLLPLTGLVLLLAGQVAHRRYRAQWDGMLLRLPFVGGLFRKAQAGRYCQSLGAMLEGGCTLSDALPIARQAVTMVPLTEAHRLAADAIRRGMPPSRALAMADLLPGDGVRLLAISERTGTLGPTLSEIAAGYSQDVGLAIKRISVLTGPALTALMGVLIAGVIAAVMLGVMGLNDVLQ